MYNNATKCKKIFSVGWLRDLKSYLAYVYSPLRGFAVWSFSIFRTAAAQYVMIEKPVGFIIR